MAEDTDDVAGECPLCFVSLTQGSLDFLHAACRAEVAALRRALEYSQLCVLGMSRRYHELARHKKPFEGCWRCPKGDAALATRGGDASE